MFSPAHHAAGVARIFTPDRDDSRAELIYADGSKAAVEFYYGSGYLSQSTRSVSVPANVVKLVVHTYTGQSREVAYGKDIAGIR